MATSAAEKRVIELSIDSGPVANQIKGINNSLASLQKTAQGVKSTFDTFKNIALGYLGIAGIQSILELADAYAILGRQVKAYTSDAKQAAAIQSELFRIAKEQGTAIKDVSASFATIGQSLKAQGGGAKETLNVIEATTAAFDALGMTGEQTATALSAVATSFNKNRVTVREYNAIVKDNVLIQKALAGTLGVSTDKLLKMAQAGKISGGDLYKALTSNLEKFKKASEDAPKTLESALTSLKNSVAELAGTLAPVIDIIAKGLSFLAANFKTIVPVIIAFGAAFTAIKFVEQAKGIVGAIDSIGGALMNLVTGNWIALIIAGLAALGTYMYLHWDKVKIIWDNFKNVWLPNWIDGVELLWFEFLDFFMRHSLGQTIIKGFTEALAHIPGAVGKVFGLIKSQWTSLRDWIEKTEIKTSKFAPDIKEIQARMAGRKELPLPEDKLPKVEGGPGVKFGELETEQDKWMKKSLANWKTYTDELGFSFKNIEGLIKNTFKGAEDAIFTFVKTGKFRLSEFFQSISDAIIRMAIQQTIIKGLSTAVGSFMPTLAANTGPVTAHGNAFGPSGIIPYAKGGIVNSPTLFKFAQGTGLMGESGSEAILPLRRSASGDLGVVSSMPASQSTQGETTINIYNSASDKVNVAAQEKETPGGSRSIEIIITDTVKKAVAGGQLDSVMGNTYGLARKGKV